MPRIVEINSSPVSVSVHSFTLTARCAGGSDRI
jgi:hypothetical protein